jgi:glutathione S-transferase
MLEQIPEPIKRERRRDVIEKGLDSPHFKVAVARMELLLGEMEQALARHAWLAADAYTLADVAYTPYLVRLEHLGILGMIDKRPHTSDWFRRLKERPSFSEAIVRWENEKYLALMTRAGAEAWPRVRAIVASV